MFKEKLKAYVQNNPSLVSMKPAGNGLYVLKYKKRVFFDNLWNRYLEECRGTIVDEDFNIVQYPFTKIYNYGVEDKAPVLDPKTRVTAYRKVNGFMAAVTWHNGDLLISTTGSTDSDFVGYVRDMIGDNIDQYRSVMEQSADYTYLFECVHPMDPHIVPEDAGMYLLGSRKKEYGSSVETGPWMLSVALDLKCRLPEVCVTNLEELLQLSKVARHEGYVFYTDDGVSAKIKSPYYLVNKLVARCGNTQRLIGQTAKARVEEEFYPLILAIRDNLEEFTALDEQARLEWVRNFLERQ